MRVIFGLFGLLVTLFVVMQLVKIQANTVAPALASPPDAAQPNADLPAPQSNPKQVQAQYQQALDDAVKAGQQRIDAAQKP